MYNTVQEYLGIVIDYERDNDITEQGLALLTGKGFYKLDHETSPQQGLARASTCYSFGDYEFAQRIYDYASKGYFTFAGAPLINAVETLWPTFSEEEFEEAGNWLEDNVSPSGMPINCFLSYIGDTREALVETRKETAWLAMMGGGIGVYSANRSPDNKSTGVMAHLRGYDADALAYKQTKAKRGSIASYMDIDHPEILSFLSMRDHTGGDMNKKCFNLHNAVNIPDSFMKAVIKDETYELTDPKHGPTGKFLRAKEVWEEILQRRFETGEPYIMYKDTVNRNIPDWITHPMYSVSQSNLCSEITLRTSNKRTAVCCLSSLNLEKYDNWKDTNIVADLIRLLDNILEYFIRLAPKELDRPRYSAIKERAIGLGTLGWHSYLQSKMIPFEGGGFGSAIQHTHILYKDIREKGIAESKRLAILRGEPDDCSKSGMRNSHLFALAPNATSSSRVGTSPSIEPWNSNAFTAQGRAGSFLIKNKYLERILESKNLNTKSVWLDILKNKGSVQHVDFLDDHQKEVFKTAYEIDQLQIIYQAGERQPYICQSQSVNIFVRNNITLEEMSNIHMLAWVQGVKTLYYCRGEETDKTDTLKKKVEYKKPSVSLMDSSCIGCEA